MVGMTDIAQFLAERFDEDEERAELAQSVIAGSWDGWGVIAPQLHACCDTVPNIDRAGQHLYVNADPARVLAEVAAKRAILAEHKHVPATEPSADDFGCQICAYDRGDCVQYGWGWCNTVLLLATPYADHPDYDPAWRVE